MATDRLTLQMSEDGGIKPLSDMPRVCATGTTPHRRTAAVKLAAKIFTALAIAFAISYVAARDYSPDASAAAGKIDVLNVGTCYATSSEVFGRLTAETTLLTTISTTWRRAGRPAVPVSGT